MIKLPFRNKYFVLLLLLIIPAFAALMKSGYFPMHDDIQGMRVLEMQKCMHDYQIPCRWVPDMGYGYGYPQFNYYAPLPYYLMATPTLLGLGILTSVKLGFLLSILGSGISMYFLGKKLWGVRGGIISALLYTYAPYRAVDVYVRGAMGEAWAFVFLPLILLFTAEILDRKRKRKYILPLALSLAGLALSHNVTVLMFIPFYALFVILYKKVNITNLLPLVISGVWGICLSAFFVLPAFFEKNYVHVETILEGYFNYLAHYVGIKQLLFSTFWGYGVSTLGPLDGLSLSVGIFIWAIPLLTLFLLVYLNKPKSLKKALAFFVLGCLALFMIHPKSQFLWDHVSVLSYVQFPWRFLSLVILFFATVSGALGMLSNKYITLGIFVLLMLMYGSFFKPDKYLKITDAQKFSGESWKQQQTISIFDYLPKGANAPPAQAAPENPYSKNASIVVLSRNLGTNWQKWDLNISEQSEVSFPTFDFPNWSAKVDGKSVMIDNNNELGLITLQLEEGEHSIELNLKNTPLRTASNILSLVALLAIAFYVKKYE